MTIADKTRKILWGRSGSRCAMCRLEIIASATELDDEAVVGDECHIVSSQKNGPRYDAAFPAEAIDSYDNLLLLCKVHHKQVDDQADTYRVDVLELIKKNHERWVAEKLSGTPEGPAPVRVRRIKKNIPACLLRILDGRAFADILFGSQAYQFDHDELATEGERDLVASFLQNAQDWAELSAEMEPGQRVHAVFELAAALRELEAAGFWVFGASEVRRLEGGIGAPSAFKVAIVSVLRKTNRRILSLSDLEGSQPAPPDNAESTQSTHVVPCEGNQDEGPA